MMKIPKEFEDVFRGVDLTEGEIRTLTWIAGWESRTVKNLRSAIQKAQDAALSALRPVSRERVEKVWRGEWVKRHKHRGGFRRVKGFDDMGEQHEVTIDERCEYDDLYCSKCGKQSPDNFLNFCGYCGAPMTDEAVEIRLKELEALKDGSTTD